ncbi:MAG: hypothetical protein JSS82_12615 [Bacteroidetes bacterium]|nr:hypothetical protein [Bacteroidota bacterium]
MNKLMMDVLVANKMLYVLGSDKRYPRIMICCEQMNDYQMYNEVVYSSGKLADEFPTSQAETKWLSEALIVTPDRKRHSLMRFDDRHLDNIPKILGYVKSEAIVSKFNPKRVDVVCKEVNFRILGSALMWLVKSSNINPIQLFTAMYTDDHFDDLLQELLPSSAYVAGKDESLDIVAAVYAVHRFYITNAVARHIMDRSGVDVVQTNIMKTMEGLLVGLRMLLARSRNQDRSEMDSIHNFVGRHDRFWVEDLMNWIDQEETLRTLQSLRSYSDAFLSRILYAEFTLVELTGKYFDLKLNVIDVGKLLHKVGVFTYYFPESAFIPSTGIPIGEIHHLTLLADRPNYSDKVASDIFEMGYMASMTMRYHDLIMQNRHKDLLLDDKHVYIRTKETFPTLSSADPNLF